jgi:DNA-binding MarR family transcriptional regulator
VTRRGRPRAEDDGRRYEAWRSLESLAARLERELSDELVQAETIPLVQYRILDELRAVGGRTTVGALAARLHAPPSSISRRIDRLEDEDLVARITGAGEDHREVVVALTSDGRAVLRSADTVVRRTLRKGVLGLVDPEVADELASICASIDDVDASGD